MLIKDLLRYHIIDKVRLINVSKNIIHTLSNKVLVVPAVFVDDKLWLIDPFKSKYIVDLILNRRKYLEAPTNINEAFDAFINTIKYNISLILPVLILKSFKPLIDREFIAVASKLRAANKEHLVNELIKNIVRNEPKIISNLYDEAVRTIAVNFIRETYWVLKSVERIKTYVSRDAIGSWILSKMSIGRIGLPYPVEIHEKLINSVYEFAITNLDGIVSYVTKEQRKILSDLEYNEALVKYG